MLVGIMKLILFVFEGEGSLIPLFVTVLARSMNHDSCNYSFLPNILIEVSLNFSVNPVKDSIRLCLVFTYTQYSLR